MRKAKVIRGPVGLVRDGQGGSLEMKLNTWLKTAGEAQILHIGFVSMGDSAVTAVILYDEEEHPGISGLTPEELRKRRLENREHR